MEIAFFVSLAVKTKLHLDRPRDERFDRQALIDYYDQFPFLPQYSPIVPRHFRPKTLNPRHKARANKVALEPDQLDVGALEEEIEMENVGGVDDNDDDDDDGDNQERGDNGDECFSHNEGEVP